MTLLARVELMKDELTQASFLDRLATVSGCPSPGSFCRDWGLSFTAVRKGQRDQLLRLADLVKADPTSVFSNAIMEVGPRSYELRGCRMISNMLRTDEVALCPECVSADLKAGADRRNPYDNVYLRVHWHLRAIETCVIHDCRLERFLLKGMKYDQRRFTTFGWDAAFQIKSGVRQSVSQKPSDLEVYLHRRLDGMKPITWLDQMPLSEVTRLCEGFGQRMSEDHAFARRLTVPDDQLREIRNKGFSLVSLGPEAVQDFLTEALKRERRRNPDAGISNVLGPALAELLHRREEATTHFSLFREEVEKFVWTNLSERFVQRAMPNFIGSLSPDQIAEQTSVSITKISQIIERRHLHPGEGGRFDPASARRIAREAKQGEELWRVKKVRELLRVSYEGLWCLSDADLLGSVQRDGTAKAKRKYRPEAVLEFMELLLAATPSSHYSPDWITPAEAAMRYRCGLDKVVELIISRSLSKVAADRASAGLEGVRFCEREFFQKLIGVSWFGISMRQTAQRLSISFEVASALLREGFLVHHRHDQSANSPVFVSEDSIQEFEKQYVPLSTLAKAYGNCSRGMASFLAKRGVHPAILRSRCGANFYRREGLIA